MTKIPSMEDWQQLRDLKMLLRALADVARLGILRQLGGRVEVTVTDLTLALQSSQPLVSWHLALLRRAGLVNTRRDGRQVYCSLNQETLARCHELLHWLTFAKELSPGETPGAVGVPLKQRKVRSCKLSPRKSSSSGHRAY